MLSRLWSLPSAATSAMMQTLQAELEHMHDRFGAVFGLLLRGDLDHFPFADASKGNFEVHTRADGVTLAYAPGWPALPTAGAGWPSWRWRCAPAPSCTARWW